MIKKIISEALGSAFFMSSKHFGHFEGSDPDSAARLLPGQGCNGPGSSPGEPVLWADTSLSSGFVSSAREPACLAVCRCHIPSDRQTVTSSCRDSWFCLLKGRICSVNIVTIYQILLKKNKKIILSAMRIILSLKETSENSQIIVKSIQLWTL